MVSNRASSFFTFASVSAVGFALSAAPASAQDPCLQPLPPILAGTFVSYFASDDLDGDGDQDVAAFQSGGISAYYNDGNGTFGGSLVHAVTMVSGVAIGDLDGDGDRDIAFTNDSSHTFNVLLNEGGGVFAAAPSCPAGSSPSDLELGDLDGDGDLDFATVNVSSVTLTLGFNQGDGVFGGTVAYAAGPAAGVSLAPAVELGDVDNDGDLDLVSSATATDGAGGQSYISVRKNSGGAVFGALQSTPHPGEPFALTLADFNGDAYPDLAVADPEGNTTRVYSNPGDGSFPGPETVYTTTSSYTIASGDLDADGDVDVVVGSSRSGEYLMFNNGAGSFTVAPIFVGGDGLPMALSDVSSDSRPEILRSRFDGPNGIEVLGNCQTPGSFRYCFGDGSSGVACPCQNPGLPQRGCGNILYPAGAKLSATGNSRVSDDTLVLQSIAMSGVLSWYFQATGQDAVPFGRGILCISGALLRVGQKSIVLGSSSNPSGADLPLHVKGALPPAGGTRYYQVSYRHANPVCTPTPVTNTNRTNGVAIVWMP